MRTQLVIIKLRKVEVISFQSKCHIRSIRLAIYLATNDVKSLPIARHSYLGNV